MKVNGKFAPSLNTQVLTKRLLEAEIGEIIPYSELSGLIDKDVQSNTGRGCLSSARRKVRSENDIVFMTVMDVGIKRCDENEKVEEAKKHQSRSTNASREGSKVLVTTQYDQLTSEKKMEFNLVASTLQAIQKIGRGLQKHLKQRVIQEKTVLELVGQIDSIFKPKKVRHTEEEEE